MNTSKTLGAVCALTVLLSGCRRMEVTTETFVNKADSTQVLKLESQPSLKLAVIGRFHNVESAGVYTLKTDKGTKSGTYTYAFDDKKQEGQYIFHPEGGERWTGKLNPGGSFTDTNGSQWNPRQVKADTKVLSKAGG